MDKNFNGFKFFNLILISKKIIYRKISRGGKNTGAIPLGLIKKLSILIK